MNVVTTIGIADSVWSQNESRLARITTSKEEENTILEINDYESDTDIILVLNESQLRDLLTAIKTVNM